MADAARPELDRIYGLPLEEFTAVRNEAAKRLKADGDAEAAAAVKSATKPSRAAWIVNRLAREEETKVGKLLDAGERLRELQEQVVAGEADPAELRKAAAAEQRGIDALLRVARKVGGATGGPTIDRVAETLQAAAGDPDLAETIRAGLLRRERRASSLGLLAAATPSPKADRKRGGGEAQERDRKAERAAAAARRRAERRVASAERSLERARGLAEAAEEALEARRAKVEKAEGELEAAEAARAELDEAG